MGGRRHGRGLAGAAEWGGDRGYRAGGGRAAEAEADGQEVDEAEALLAEMEEQDRAAEQEGLEIGD